ncbi:MAG: hypothetical protein FWD68_02360 [Alphaproteobacteria bacterium]|nr:hypothetical protein [Alphaproteobacteria bacterium]
MSRSAHPLTNLATGLDLPLEAIELAALPVDAELDSAELQALAAEFDRYTDLILAQYLAPAPSPEQVSVLKQYIAGASPGVEIRALLKTSAALRAALHGMIAELVTGPPGFTLAPVAAASEGELDQRRFDGGMVTLAPATGHATQIYLVIDYDDPRTPARTAIQYAEDGSDIARLTLDDRFEQVEDGVIQRLLDLTDPEVEHFVALLRDPTSRGKLSR